MNILGINGVSDIFHDASATLVVDGEIVASVEEERFNRQKHSNGIPFQAIEYCLRRAGISFTDLDHIGYYLDPAVLRKSFYDDILTRFDCNPAAIDYCRSAAARIQAVPKDLARYFPFAESTKFHFLNHHLAHAASAYYPSGWNEAAVLTLDGSGDRETGTLYHGIDGRLEHVHDFMTYPYSLGFIYTLVAGHLGLGWIEGPGKLMGLAGFGAVDEHLYADVIKFNDDPQNPIEVDLSFFGHHIGQAGFPAKGLERFGPAREKGTPLTRQHLALAASTQHTLERAILHIARAVRKLLPQTDKLCFAGGIALNVCANRRILDEEIFADLFVTPPAYDGGTSLGCALHLAVVHGDQPKAFNVYCGPHIAEDFSIPDAVAAYANAIVIEQLDEDALCEQAADMIAGNALIGWAQGRMECGPRALGARSVLTNAANPLAKDELNTRFKRREPFRPYAPAVLEEESLNWFDLERSPHMLLEARVHADKRDLVPGIVHVDGTARPQTVTAEGNPRFHLLLRKVFERTGVPMVVNTSFNMHGEPIVNSPADAINDLLNTQLDALFLEDYVITRKPGYTPDASKHQQRTPAPRPVTVPAGHERAVAANQAFSHESETSVIWADPFETLRQKWHEVPSGDQRRSTRDLLNMSPADLVACWTQTRDSAVSADGYAVRGWYHALYKDIFRGKRIMDVGSGFGLDGITYAQHGAKVTFVDIVESNLKILRRLCEGLGLTEVGFCYLRELASMQKLPRDYDAIYCQGSLINAPCHVIRSEVQALLDHLPVGGRWVELAYPKRRWEREGCMPFETWGDVTDGGAPWMEWYDFDKRCQSLAPATFETNLYFEFHDGDFNWFDLVRRS